MTCERPMAGGVATTRYSGLGLVLAVLVVGEGPALGSTSIDVSLVNPGSSTVPSGTPVELQIVGSSDAALTATAYTITVTQDSNDAGAHLNARSADPNGRHPQSLDKATACRVSGARALHARRAGRSVP